MGGWGSGRSRTGTKRHQVELCWVLGSDLLSGHRPVPGDEGVATLRCTCAPAVQVPYVVRQPGDGLVLTLLYYPSPNRTGFFDIRLTSSWVFDRGRRVYFECPGLLGHAYCGARVAKLYWPMRGSQSLACRRCHGLAYRSSQERPINIASIKRRVYGAPLWPRAYLDRPPSH